MIFEQFASPTLNKMLKKSFSSAFWRCFALILLNIFIFSVDSIAQEDAEYEEVAIFFQVQNMGGIDVSGLIRDQEILLPVSSIFDFLKIKNTLSTNMDSISGFFLSPEASFLIDHSQQKISFQGKNYALKKKDLIRTETSLYLSIRYFGEVFGLDCKFSFRALSVFMTTKLELPVMREMRLEMMRQNINRLKGNVKVDSVIPRSRPAFHFGMADWSVISTQDIGTKTDTRINLALGSVIAGGEANFFLNYATNEPFSEKQQYYNWRFVNNQGRYLKQTTLGKISTDAISSIYNPVVGVKLTNTPTTYRKSFGTYPISDYTNPGWMVELYVNNVLVDYKKADASGFYTFQIPMVYGNSSIKLKFYGPWGEERFKEQNINIPFTFLPAKEMEYTINAGMVEDSLHSVFARGSLNFGISKHITVGTGVEYLSSISSMKTLPFVTLAMRPLPSMIVSGEYTFGVRAKGIVTYHIDGNIEAELNFTKYEPGQTAVNYNYLEERKAILTLPLKGKRYSIFNRLTYDNIILPSSHFSTAEWLISGAIHGVSTNLTNYAMLVSQGQAYVYSNLSFSFRLPSGITFIPQAQYEYGQHELISAKAGFEKYLFKNGFLSLTYENNFKSGTHSLQFGFRYDLPFAQTGFTARQTNRTTSIMEMARGSLIVDPANSYVGASNRTAVGKGGIVFSPFLDVNCNGKKDKGEPKILGLDIRMSGGLISENEKDSTVRVTDVEPYTTHLVELDANSFDNIAWKLKYRTFSVVVDPNLFKRIEIPIAVVGEASGTVFKETEAGPEGIGRIVIHFYDKHNHLAGKTLSEPDGFFSYLGLSPGTYEARVDPEQLAKLHLTSSPQKQTITIHPNANGDTVEGIDFVLKKLEKP